MADTSGGIIRNEFRALLQFIPALFLLLVNGHLVGNGDLVLLAQTERAIWALSRADRAPLVSESCQNCSSVQRIIRALAWVSRWQSPAPQQLASSPSDSVRFDWPEQPLRLPIAHQMGDRSRDGPVRA